MVESIQHTLEQLEPGIVWLDQSNVITAMNAVAAETFGDSAEQLIGKEVLEIHPERSREKIRTLFDKASSLAGTTPPMTMMLSIPERVLLIKLSSMAGPAGGVGACMVFFDITALTRGSDDVRTEARDSSDGLQLVKVPVYKNKQVFLVGLDKVACIKADGHYSTLFTDNDSYLCNLNLIDLERRIRLPHFVRVHRSFIVNLHYAKSFECGPVGAEEKLARRHHTLAVRPPQPERGVAGKHQCRVVVGRIAVTDIAANRAAIADLGVRNVASGFGQQRTFLTQQLGIDQRVFDRHRTDANGITVIMNAPEFGNPVDVDQVSGFGKAQLHHRQQAVAACQQLGIIRVLRQQTYGFLHSGRCVVFKCVRYHSLVSKVGPVRPGAHSADAPSGVRQLKF